VKREGQNKVKKKGKQGGSEQGEKLIREKKQGRIRLSPATAALQSGTCVTGLMQRREKRRRIKEKGKIGDSGHWDRRKIDARNKVERGQSITRKSKVATKGLCQPYKRSAGRTKLVSPLIRIRGRGERRCLS